MAIELNILGQFAALTTVSLVVRLGDSAWAWASWAVAGAGLAGVVLSTVGPVPAGLGGGAGLDGEGGRVREQDAGAGPELV